jgi:3-deoxy-7-phosphoheptulonate synthase
MTGSRSAPYKLASWGTRIVKTVVRIGHVEIGNGDLTVIAGPCAVESRDQLFTIASQISQMGVKLFRGGAFDPQASPYSFKGLGEEGLKMLAEVREQYGLLIVSECFGPDSTDLVERYADVIQIGAPNMQNFGLLRRAGRAFKPVMLERGLSATLEEFLLAAEYILAEGNPNVILCESGIRTFADHARFMLDLAMIPAIQRLSHLPIIVDPSRAAGDPDQVIPLARAGVAAGADGIMVEVHHKPENALSHGEQALTPEMFRQMYDEVHQIRAVFHQKPAALAAS